VAWGIPGKLLMSRRLRAGLLVSVVALLGGLALALHTWFARPLSIDWFFARMQTETLRGDPEQLAARGGWLADWEGANRRLTDLSPAARETGHARLQRNRETLSGYRCVALEGERRQSCEVLGYSLDMQIEAYRWRHYDHPINPLFGLQNQLPAQLLGSRPFTTPADADAYLSRLAAVAGKLDGLLLDLQERRQAGVLPPRSMVPRVLDDLRGFVRPVAPRHMLVTVLQERLAALPRAQMPEVLQRRFVERAEALLTDSVYPAWQRLIVHFESLQALPLSDDGAWSKPDGGDYYAFMARWHTTTDLAPDAIHQIGLDEVARLSAELDVRLADLGLIEGGIGQRLRDLGARVDQRFGSGESARQDALDVFRGMIDEAMIAAEPAFQRLPQTALLAEAVPVARERSAPGAYYSPPSTAGLPGKVYLNLRELDDLPRFTLRSLSHHEAVPGHHLQSAWALERTDLPAFRRQLSFSAYAEGWAMYAEQLAAELGLLTSPEDDVGRLQAELFRAARLVVDTGLHRKRWSVGQAETYMRDIAGLGAAEARAEVERYLVYPGQALCFHIGLQRFRTLRANAEQALGEDFSLPAFHSMLLDGGRLPLDLLQTRSERWVAAERKRGGQP
jgi:uncharacterized protein (DUF885 family)